MESHIGEAQLLSLMRSAGTVGSPDELEAVLLRPVAELLGATTTAWFQLEMRGGSPQRVERASLGTPIAGVLEPYSGSLFRTDPLYEAAPAQAACMSEIMAADHPHPQIDSYYREFLRPQGIGDILGAYFPVMSVTGEVTYSISFPRRLGLPTYSPHETKLLAQITPLFALAISNFALRQDVLMMRNVVDDLASFMQAKISISDGAGWRQTLADGSEAPPAKDARSALGGSHLTLLVETGGLANKLEGSDLTRRELEIISFLKHGHSNASLAHSLGISVRTVENHLRSIYQKVRVSSRTQLLYKIYG